MRELLTNREQTLIEWRQTFAVRACDPTGLLVHDSEAVAGGAMNARFRRAINARGHFPTEQAATKCLYMVVRSLDPKGTGRTKWAMRWLSRPGARCRHCCRSVSPGRSPNPACASPRTGLSTIGSVKHGSAAGKDSGSRLPGSGSG